MAGNYRRRRGDAMNTDYCEYELRDTVYRALISSENFMTHIREIFTLETEYGLYPYVTITSSYKGKWRKEQWRGVSIEFIVNIFVQEGGSQKAYQLLQMAKSAVGVDEMSMENYQIVKAKFGEEDVSPMQDGITMHASFSSKVRIMRG